MASADGERSTAAAFHIALASSPEVPLLVELMREFYAESGYPLDGDWAAQSFRALLADASLGSAWTARDRRETAGYVVLTVRYALEHGGLEGWIDDLFVRAAHRRRGCATALVDALADDCRRRGVVALHVEVGDTNAAAIALYRRFGLQTRSDRRRVMSGRLAAR
ncbi:MAG TPA: GNAT family N-acetyltransferase [Casimicrobiaceae bacterium]